ncbi:MAG: hypothetical protein ACTSRK_16305 [Promethearchaeota archaeon]
MSQNREKVFIDTEIWSFALKNPTSQQVEVTPSLKVNHVKANDFLVNCLTNFDIFISTHQLTEIFHVLAYRGKKLSKEDAQDYITTLIDSENIFIIPTQLKHIQKSMSLSVQSGVHIYDFLCVLPIISKVESLYSCDTHFTTPIFESFKIPISNLKIPISNPLDVWLKL